MHIAIFSPYLQGFYFGELCNQLRQFCVLKRFKFSVIRTDSLGSFSIPISLSQYDGVVILRNAISNELAKQILDRGIPVVSIAYDFFPLEIPIISSDNDYGVEIAFNYFISNGHSKIAYVGDLSQYDLRRRYEAYCDQLEINLMTLNEDYVYAIDDTRFSGGYTAAERFLAKDCDATAILCGAGLTAIGFCKHYRELHPDPSPIKIAGFDAIPITPVLEPDIAMIDQNLHLIAHAALNNIESQINGESVQANTIIEPKLITKDDDIYDCETTVLSTCVELSELNNNAYSKSVIANFYEWPREILRSNLDDIMSLSPIFERFMQLGCLSRFSGGESKYESLRVVKIYTPQGNQDIREIHTLSTSATEEFPPPILDTNEDFEFSSHFPIFIKNRAWGMISMYGSSQVHSSTNSFLGFTGYMDIITKMLALELETKLVAKKQNEKKDSSTKTNILTYKISWNVSKSLFEWDTATLDMLGLTTDLEHNIYRNMDIIDRIHLDDETRVRNLISNAIQTQTPFSTEARFKLKGNTYKKFEVACNISVNGENEILSLFHLTSTEDLD